MGQFDVHEFKKLRERFKNKGVVFPTLRAFFALVGEDYEKQVDADNYYAYCELRHGRWTLSFVDCFTAGKVTNLQLCDDSGEVWFYSGEE